MRSESVDCFNARISSRRFGPYAFAFSILPFLKDKIIEWFGVLLGIGFVFTTLNHLDHFSYYIMGTIIENKDFSFIDRQLVTAVNCMMIILYLMSFWLTSKYVGKGDGGRFVSKSLQMATLAAVAAFSGGAGAAAGGGAAGKSSQASNAMGAAGDLFKDEG